MNDDSQPKDPSDDPMAAASKRLWEASENPAASDSDHAPSDSSADAPADASSETPQAEAEPYDPMAAASKRLASAFDDDAPDAEPPSEAPAPSKPAETYDPMAAASKRFAAAEVDEADQFGHAKKSAIGAANIALGDASARLAVAPKRVYKKRTARDEKRADMAMRWAALAIGVVILLPILWLIGVSTGMIGQPSEEEIELVQDAETMIEDLRAKIEIAWREDKVEEGETRYMPASLPELADILKVEVESLQNGFNYTWRGEIEAGRFKGEMYAEPLDPNSGLLCVGKYYSGYNVVTTKYAWDLEDLKPEYPVKQEDEPASP